jgi:ketosteroid isomerase-like protein
VLETTREAKRGRSLLERLLVRRPAIVHAITGLTLRLPSGPLRSALLRYGYRRAYAAWNRRDWEINTLAMADDYEFRGHEGIRLPETQEVSYGREGYLEQARDLFEAWDELKIVLEDVLDAGPNRLIVLTRFFSTGRESGMLLDTPAADVHVFRDGQVIRQDLWGDRAAALRSVGLDPAIASRARPGERTR